MVDGPAPLIEHKRGKVTETIAKIGKYVLMSRLLRALFVHTIDTRITHVLRGVSIAAEMLHSSWKMEQRFKWALV
jgi:hypothetical protein